MKKDGELDPTVTSSAPCPAQPSGSTLEHSGSSHSDAKDSFATVDGPWALSHSEGRRGDLCFSCLFFFAPHECLCRSLDRAEAQI